MEKQKMSQIWQYKLRKMLSDFASDGNIRGVRRCLAEGIEDINAYDFLSLNPLDTAVIHGQKEIVELLLLHGADPDAAAFDGMAPLITSLLCNHKPEISALLIKASRNVNKSCYEGCYPLHFAIALQLKEAVKLLISHGADIEIKETKKIDKTPLMGAVITRNQEIITYLLQQGANINAQSIKEGTTALILAAYYGFSDIVKLLLEYKPDLELTCKLGGFTALSYAIAARNKEIVQLLLAAGAKPQQGKTGMPYIFKSSKVKEMYKNIVLQPQNLETIESLYPSSL